MQLTNIKYICTFTYNIYVTFTHNTAASVLGIAFDELVRHHPTIRKDLLGSFSKILEEILLYETSCKDKDFVISWTVGKSGSTEGLTSEAQFPANQPRLEHNAPTLHPSSSSDILDVMEVQDDDILSGAEEYVS